jgi:3-phosphoshikimate 1-carboxyvinyltransferase
MIRVIEVRPLKEDAEVVVPGSKSYTHRSLIAAALSDGVCRIANPLRSEDTRLTIAALKQLGVAIEELPEGLRVTGRNGRFSACADPIYLGNAGTAMRLLAGLAVLGQGEYLLTGTPRMCERPIHALLDGLNELGIAARARKGNGCPPVVVPGGTCRGGRTRIDCSVSSQFLSALLLIAPCLADGLIIEVTKGPVSRPYIDMTLDIMQRFGLTFARLDYTRFEIPGGQTYRAQEVAVEADASQAGYFWAAAAVNGTRIKVRGVTRASRQGDVGLAEVFEQMGCRVEHAPDGIAVTGGSLRAVDADMGHMPDMVPTLAVAAAFAQGETVLRNVAHLRAKESDRLAAVSRELGKMGIKAECGADELRILGGRPHGATIDTYDDHRIAMSFAVAGLATPGVSIIDPGCVAKSFPNFWDVLEQLYS